MWGSLGTFSSAVLETERKFGKGYTSTQVVEGILGDFSMGTNTHSRPRDQGKFAYHLVYDKLK
jgi:hypothetical protein